MKLKSDQRIGKRAREVLEARIRDTGEEVKAMCDEIGIDRRAMYSWANDCCPSADNLKALALAGFDIYYILTGKKEEE